MGNCSFKKFCNKVPVRWSLCNDKQTELVPCTHAFPSGLGPLTVRNAKIQTGDISVLRIDEDRGGSVLLSRSALQRSEALQILEAELCRQGILTSGTRGGAASSNVLELRVSPSHPVTFPASTRSALALPLTEEIHFAWVYPVTFQKQANSAVGKNPTLRDRSRDVLLSGCDSSSTDSNLDSQSGQVIDVEDADVSFLTVGGFIYFRPLSPTPSHHALPDKKAKSSAPLMGSVQPVVLDLLCARSIRYSPTGALQFAAPRPLDAICVEYFVKQGRFQPVTARVWILAGARYFCWIRPEESVPDTHGCERPHTRHGGFAFIFHELTETDKEGNDCYFAVVSEPDIVPGASAQSTTHNSTNRISSSSLPFNIQLAPTETDSRQLERFFELSQRGRWKLVRHLLAEYPHFATSTFENGSTLLHLCAEKNALDADLLSQLKALGAQYDAQDAEGRIPEALGNKAFKSILRSVYKVSPDLFEDPGAWFDFWDRNFNGLLEPDELGDALSYAFQCDAIGTQWVKSYVNIHHQEGVNKSELTASKGLLDALQGSEEFAALRLQKTPPMFRGPSQRLTKDGKAKLLQFEGVLTRMQKDHGWEVGKLPPRAAMPLPLPAPSPEGSADPEERMLSARNILGFSFEQTRGLPGSQWQAGFRIDFAGQEGLDEGGLTKAWVSEIGYALWGDNVLFDLKADGSFFKPDEVGSVQLDGVPVSTTDLYHWTGRFVAYALYQRCLLDVRLLPWCFRVLQRARKPTHYFNQSSVSEWPETPEGEDAMLSDLASLDHTVASNLWRVRHEMSDDDLQWLDFTCSGTDLLPDGEHVSVDSKNKQRYIRLFCEHVLHQRCKVALQAFVKGFYEVLLPNLFVGMPEEGVLRLLAGKAEVSDQQLEELENLVVPNGLVPTKLRDHPLVREAASWLFRAAREGDMAFRARLLEFWLGVDRLPLAGCASIRPPPRLQIMVQTDGSSHLKRIASWPKERLPEGHTCGNELWMALYDGYEEAKQRLRLAVENFEAGFALR